MLKKFIWDIKNYRVKIAWFLKTHGVAVLISVIFKKLMRHSVGKLIARRRCHWAEQQPKPVHELITRRFPDQTALRWFHVPRLPPRINLIIDGFNNGASCPQTVIAVTFAALWAQKLNCNLRIISTQEKPSTNRFREILQASNISFSQNVDFTVAHTNDIATGADDIFIGTSWRHIVRLQKNIPASKIVYLIQSDESFYCETSEDRIRQSETFTIDSIRFVVGTEILYQALIRKGNEAVKTRGVYFEPAVPYITEPKQAAVKKQLLFVADPANNQSLFYRGIEAIDMAITNQTLSLSEWNIVIVGPSLPLRLGADYVPVQIENPTLQEYRTLLAATDLGFYLIYDTAPGYPVLELAANNAVVVTNSLDYKQSLATYSQTTICKDLSVESLSQGLAEASQQSADQTPTISRDWPTSFASVFTALKSNL